MPIYEYRCSSCGHQQEYLQKLSDPPHTKCVKCGAEALTKMVTAAGFQLKGSGWYATDFKGSGSKPAAKTAAAGDAKAAATGDAKPAESKSEAKAETKTETKSETKKEAAGPTPQ
jgi:putative FmdB family regulatory protein